MSETVEFSETFRLLNEIKEGASEKNILLEEKIIEYKEAKDSAGYLDELGKRFISIGITELFKYANSKDLKLISSIDKESWVKLAEEKEYQLPQYLANAMIASIKENQLSKQIAQKWSIRERELNKHVRPMAQYITEGIIELLE